MPHDDGVTSAWFEWIYEKEDLSKVLVVEVSFDTVCAIPPGGVSLDDGRIGDGRRGNSMIEKRRDRSRREVIRAVAKGVPAGFLLRISQTEASEKMTRQQAEYQDMPKDIYSCGMCTLFEPPKYCKVMAGEVSRDGWCKAFVLAD
jgi:hypothetical protein